LGAVYDVLYGDKDLHNEVLMKHVTEVHFFGSLAIARGGNPTHRLQFAIQGPMALSEFLSFIQIPPDKVQLAMVNHKAVRRDYMIHPGDRVALFPEEYPVYPDWKEFRS
jgi:molybdopterin converting factor small subunit